LKLAINLIEADFNGIIVQLTLGYATGRNCSRKSNWFAFGITPTAFTLARKIGLCGSMSDGASRTKTILTGRCCRCGTVSRVVLNYGRTRKGRRGSLSDFGLGCVLDYSRTESPFVTLLARLVLDRE
jgi:hypothetical protein